MEAVLLKFLDLFRGVFILLKVDYEQLRAIVAIKLTMDNRRQVVVYNRRKDNLAPANGFFITLFFYAMFGGIIALVMSSPAPTILSMIMFFSYLMVMIVMTLVADFSSVLLDTSDNTIILPRPVDSRTLFMARSAHIFLYLAQLALGLSAFPCVAVLVRHGFAALVIFLILIALSVMTAVSLTNIFYLLILQFTNEERLKSVINYFQITMAVVVMGGYQLLPRLTESSIMVTDREFQFPFHWWHVLIPPLWMATAMYTFLLKSNDILKIFLTVCAVIVPLAGFFVMNRYLTPVFSRKLGAMGSGGKAHATNTSTTQRRNLWLDRIAPLVTSGPLERGSFELIYRILGRDRKIKLKLYPAFGYVLVFGMVFILRSAKDLDSMWSSLPHTYYYLVLLYLMFMVLQVALSEIPYSDDFKAAWIYFSLPLEKPGEVLAGMFKAILVRLFVPAYIIVSIFVMVVWGIQAIDDVVFGFFNNILMFQIIALISNRHLPLSMAPNVRGQTGNFMRAIVMFALVGSLGFTHYLLTTYNPIILLALIPVQAGVSYLLLQLYRKTTWDSITY